MGISDEHERKLRRLFREEEIANLVTDLIHSLRQEYIDKLTAPIKGDANNALVTLARANGAVEPLATLVKIVDKYHKEGAAERLLDQT